MSGITGYDKDGNPVSAGSAAEADALYEAGKLRFLRGQKINVKTYDGRVVPLNAEDYGIARQKGAVIVSDDEARAERKAEEIRDAGALAAFGRGAASTVVDPLLAVGANLGVTKDLRDISRDALKNQATDLEASEKEFAGATAGGKLFGYVAPTLLTGGANLAARGGAQLTAKGLAAAAVQRTTVAGISNVAGETAAQLAVKGMAKLGAGKVATNVAKWSAQGAAEGLVQGAADSMVQATLDNPDKVAESMLMGAGTGALYGAAGNVILGGIGKGIARGATASKDAIKGLAQRVTRGAAQELGEVNPAVLGAAESATARYLGAIDEDSFRGVSNAKAGPAARAAANVTGAAAEDVESAFSAKAASAIDNPDLNTEQTAEELGNRMRSIFEDSEIVDEATSMKGAQYETMRRLVDDGADGERAADFGIGVLGRMRAAVSAVAEDPNASRLAGFTRFRKAIDDGAYDDALLDALKKDKPAAAVAEVIDKLKADAQATFASKGRSQDPAVTALQRQMQDAAQALRNDMEGAGEVFGQKFADWHKAKNAGWNEQLLWKNKFGKEFLDMPEQELASFDIKRDINPVRLTSYAKQMSEFEMSNKARALFQDMSGRRARMQAVVDFADADPAVVARAKKAIAEIDDFAKWHAGAADINRSVRSAEKVAGQAQRRAIFGGAIAAGAGMAAGMGGGEAAVGGGMVGTAIANPALAARMLAAARVSIGKRSGAILGAAGGVANRARGITEGIGKAARPAGRALVGGALFMAYRDKVREIVDATTNVATVPELDTITPGLSGALAAKRAAALDFLKSKAPTGALGGGGMFAHLETPPVTEYQARRFFEYVRGVEDPLAVLEQVKSGDISPEAIEAVRAVYPETFAEMQQVVTEQLAGLKEPPPYESRLELYRVFGVASDRSLSPEFFATVQSLPGTMPTEAPQQRPAGAAKAGQLSQLTLSDTARIQTR